MSIDDDFENHMAYLEDQIDDLQERIKELECKLSVLSDLYADIIAKSVDE